MSVMTLPTGISVAQAKKDAKKLAQRENIQLSEAQDRIAFEHGRSKWAALSQQLKAQESLKLHLHNPGGLPEVIALPARKSLTCVIGMSGCGKSSLLRECAAQWLKQGFPIVYLGACLKECNQLTSQYPTLFRAFDIDEDIDFERLRLDGAILIIDELFFVLNSPGRQNEAAKLRELSALIDCSMHTLVSGQVISDIEGIWAAVKNVPETAYSFILLPGSQRGFDDRHTSDLSSEEQQSLNAYLVDLKMVQEQYSEFIWFSRVEGRKLRYHLR